MDTVKKKEQSKMEKDPAAVAMSRIVNDFDDITNDFYSNYIYKCDEFIISDTRQKETYENIMNHSNDGDKYIIIDKKIFTSNVGIVIFLEYYEKKVEEKTNSKDSESKKEKPVTELEEVKEEESEESKEEIKEETEEEMMLEKDFFEEESRFEKIKLLKEEE
jgi:deoxyribodipyrimidine photolyase